MANQEVKIKISAEENTTGAFGSVFKSLEGLTGKVAICAGKWYVLKQAIDTFIGPIIDVAEKAAKVGDELYKMSQIVGINIESLSGIKYAAEMADVGIDDLRIGLGQFSQQVQNASAGSKESITLLNSLGISYNDAAGKIKPTEELLLDVAEVFKQMPAGAEKTARAMDLFGRSGAQLIPFLNEGKDGLEELMKEAKKLGLVISEDAGKASEEFMDNLKRLTKTFEGLAIGLGQQIIPAINEFFHALKEGRFNSVFAELYRLSMLVDKIGGSLTQMGMLLYLPGHAMGNENSIKQFEKLAEWNRVLEERHKESEKALQKLADEEVKYASTGVSATSQIAEAQIGTNKILHASVEELTAYIDKIKELGQTNLEFGAEGLKEVFDNLKTGGDNVDELKKQIGDASGAVYKYGKVVDEVYKAQQSAIQEVIKQLAGERDGQDGIYKAAGEYSKTELSRLKTNMSAYETYYDFLKGKMDEAINKQKTLNDEIGAAKKTLSETAQGAILEIKAPEMTDAQKLSSQMTDALGLQGSDKINALNQYIQDVKKSSIDTARKVSMIYDAESIGKGVTAETTTKWQEQDTTIKSLKTSMDDVKKTIDEYKTEVISLSAEIDKIGKPIGINLDTTDANTMLKTFLDSIPNSKTILIKTVYQSIGATSAGATSAGATSADTTSADTAKVETYASGTDYVPRTGLALLHQGERVLTASENKTYNNNNQKSFSPNITINSSGGGMNTRALAKQVSKEMQKLQYLM